MHFKLIRPCINSNPTGYPYVRLYDFRHVKPADTFWYLSATPELLKALCSKYEEQFGGNDDEI